MSFAMTYFEWSDVAPMYIMEIAKEEFMKQ